MSRPYSISLLNDLHEHFPDLLYQPDRFRNVGDILNYIITVARQSPYDAARAEHERRVHQEAPRRTAPRTSLVDNVISNSDDLYRILHGTLPAVSNLPAVENPPLPSLFSVRPSRSAMASISQRHSVSATDPIMSFLGELIGNPVISEPSVSLPAFLDQRVIVRPTEQQIQAASVLTTINPHPNENCAICQDVMEDGQSVRILSHCIHRFHQECIDTWFQSHVTCPTCRHDIRESS